MRGDDKGPAALGKGRIRQKTEEKGMEDKVFTEAAVAVEAIKTAVERMGGKFTPQVEIKVLGGETIELSIAPMYFERAKLSEFAAQFLPQGADTP
jgi:hypothetical protein